MVLIYDEGNGSNGDEGNGSDGDLVGILALLVSTANWPTGWLEPIHVPACHSALEGSMIHVGLLTLALSCSSRRVHERHGSICGMVTHIVLCFHHMFLYERFSGSPHADGIFDSRNGIGNVPGWHERDEII